MQEFALVAPQRRISVHWSRRRFNQSACAALATGLCQSPDISYAATPQQAAPDDVAARGLALLERYVATLYASGPPATPIGGEQAFPILALNRSSSEYADANTRLNAYLAKLLQERYWIASSPSDLSAYWQQTSLIKLMLDPALAMRLSSENREAIKALLFNFLVGFSDEYVKNGLGNAADATDIHGSDNHDIIRHGFFLLGSQILAADPAYAQKPLPGSTTPAGLATRFSGELGIVLAQRGATGLVAEIGSPSYAGVYLQTLFVVADHAADPALRHIATQFLDLVFADAAQETLAGVRGGARSRAYKTAAAYDAREDSFTVPLFLLTGLPASGPLWPLREGYVPPRDAFAALTTGYRLPPVIDSLFRNRAALGRFQYDTSRPSTGSEAKAAVRGDAYPVYHPDRPPRFVRCSYVTPFYVLGWFTIDEQRPELMVQDQNEEMGVITSSPNGRIAITGTPTNADRRTSYADLQSVGAGPAVLIRRNIHARGRLPLRLFLSQDMSLRQAGPWLVATSGDGASWFALRSMAPGGGALEPSDWGKDIPGAPVAGSFFVIPADATLALEAGCGSQGAKAHFIEALGSSERLTISADGGTVRYQPVQGAVLQLFKDARTPQIDGRPVALPPPRTYDSPYLRSSDDPRLVTATAPNGGTLSIDLA